MKACEQLITIPADRHPKFFVGEALGLLSCVVPAVFDKTTAGVKVEKFPCVVVAVRVYVGVVYKKVK